MRRILLVVAALAALAGDLRAAPREIRYALDVTVDAHARRVTGTARITVENPGPLALGELWLWRYPERLAARSPALNDYNFYWVYPRLFNPASMRTGAVIVDGRAQQVDVMDQAPAGRRTLLRVKLDRPLQPGARAELAVDFETEIPTRYGAFGCFRGTCTLGGGFYPMLAGFAPDGRADLNGPPARATYRVTVRVARAGDVIVNGNFRALAPSESWTVELDDARAAALVVGPPKLRKLAIEHRDVHVELYTSSWKPVPSPPGAVLPYLPADRAGHMLQTARDAIDLLAEGGHALPAGTTIRLVEGALRVELAESLPGFVLASDQLFNIFPFDRFLKFHEFELARAIYAQLVEARIAAREPPGDLGWAPEVAASALVDRFTLRAYRREEYAEQILKWAAFIPAIDRILYAPQLPFSSAYFYTLDDPDPLRDSLAQFNNDRPTGKLIYAKLRDLVGDPGVNEIVKRQLAGEPLRAAAEAVYKKPLDWFFEQWLGKYPGVDYRFAEVRSERRGEGFVHTAVVEKRGANPPVEPVEVRARDRRGHEKILRWDGDGERHAFEFELPAELSLLELDPRGRLIEELPGSNDDLRFNDRRPARWKFIYNNFGGLVRVFPTLGLDLSLDFSLQHILDLKNAFRFVLYNNSAVQIGLQASYTRGFGKKITRSSLAQAVTATLGASRLDPSFGVLIGGFPGSRLSFGMSWGYDDRLFVWEPLRALSLGATGSLLLTILDNGSVLTQGLASVGWESIVPLADGHGLALRASAAITFGDFRIPSQMLGSGGPSALRGYAVDDLLGLASILWRTEYRHVWVHSLDVNLLHIVNLRGIGGGAFVEGAFTSSCSSYSFQANSIAADVGYTLRLFGDWFGASQTTLNIDLAVPLVHQQRDCFGQIVNAGTRAPIGFFFAFGPPW